MASTPSTTPEQPPSPIASLRHTYTTHTRPHPPPYTHTPPPPPPCLCLVGFAVAVDVSVRTPAPILMFHSAPSMGHRRSHHRRRSPHSHGVTIAVGGNVLIVLELERIFGIRCVPYRVEANGAMPCRFGVEHTRPHVDSASRATPLPLPLPPPFHSTPLPRHRHATATATEMRRGAPRHDTQLSAGIAERKSGKAMRTPVCASNLCCAPCEWHSAHRAHAAVYSPALWCCMDCTWDPSHCCSGARCCNMSHCFATWRLTVLQRGGYCVAQLLPL